MQTSIDESERPIALGDLKMADSTMHSAQGKQNYTLMRDPRPSH